ncbi:dihydroneopterin aldolase [Stenotrophomonas maltophilia RA8]|nr:dihydroneopterin aldolase [Stenotrophomonas maltophilia RA8]
MPKGPASRALCLFWSRVPAGHPPPVPGRLTAVPLPWPPVLGLVSAMDKVFIEGLTIDALIGIYDWERRIRQDLVFDLEMGFDNRRPAASDDIAHTLNYKAVSKRLEQFVRESEFGLVETLAERCAQIVLSEFDVKWLRLKLSKPGAVRGARAVGVIIERTRD